MKNLAKLAFAAALCALSAAPAKAQGQLNMICAPAAEWCEAIAAGFTRDTGIKVNMTRKSAGEILAQLRAEAQNPKTDIWFGGSSETHLAAVEENLLDAYSSPNMAGLYPWAIKTHQVTKGHAVGVSSGAIGITYNTELMAKKNLPIPTSWADLLMPVYKGEMQMPNPNSSGTAYTIVAGLVQIMGEDKAFDYMKALHGNMNAYTRSGAAPLQAVARGETALALTFNMETQSVINAGMPVKIIYPAEGTSYEVAAMSIVKGARNLEAARKFYDWYLTPAAMDIGPKVNQWHSPAHMKATPDARLVDMSKVKLIDNDLALYGSNAMRKKLIGRWDSEIGALPR